MQQRLEGRVGLNAEQGGERPFAKVVLAARRFGSTGCQVALDKQAMRRFMGRVDFQQAAQRRLDAMPAAGAGEMRDGVDHGGLPFTLDSLPLGITPVVESRGVDFQTFEQSTRPSRQFG